MSEFFVYIFTNRTKTIFNIGITNDLGLKLNEVGDTELGRNAKSIYLIYYKSFPSYKEAKEAEVLLKRKSRIKQEMEIKAINPRLIFLNPLFSESTNNLISD